MFHSDKEPLQQTEPSFVLKEYEGRLAVFETEQDTPREVFDININIFPENDIEALKNGIPAENEEELMRLIEDFSG